MAKKKDKEKDRPSRADAVRSAVDQAFQATAGGAAALTRERATDLADELSGVVARLRETLDENRPASGGDLGDLREQVAALRARVDALDGLAARVDALEAAGASAPAPKAAPAAKRAPRSRAATTQAAAKRAQAAAKGPAATGRRASAAPKADSGASEAASAGTASDGDVKQASAAAKTTRARAAAGRRAAK